MARARIERMTDLQTAALPVFRDEWFRAGTCTGPADRPRAEKAITEMYAVIREPAPKFLWCDSPMTAHLAMSLLEDWGLRASLWASLRDSLRDSLGDSLWDSLRASLGDSLWASLGDSLGASLGASLGDCKVKYRPTSLWGQQDSYWIAFYVFARDVLGVSYDPESSRRLDLHASVARSCMWFWPFQGLCVVSERPSSVHIELGALLHHDGGPAVAFRDGWGVHALNGVRVPAWLAETPAEQLDARKLAEIANAEVRREFVRKLGVDRLLHTLSPGPIDAIGEYELHLLDFGDGRQRPYLKMHNPSVPEVWHVEGVQPGCTTVLQAIVETRNGIKAAQVDAIGGAEYYQQGDILLFPEDSAPVGGKHRVKPFPVQLT